MKRIFSTCLLLAACYITKAQNNLQFNRVVIVKADSISNCSNGCPDTILLRTFTVSQGKVLKIESINFIPGNYYTLFLDNTPFAKTTSGLTNSFPIWLPSGTYSIYFGTYSPTSSATGQYAYLLSGIEFNVVQ
ncbi:hypothetical protein [Ferruginibacter albus]|uniref:hypothetical protein n=1 Tax=Ferruginibacter albus TaxID=2875540 RepID=UPI001CC768D1|nr:hypothetical protein [Ferruginibacter albus]UAY53450.1 hypothetical protein K9M53_07190 [Ferruginibacter albus]